MEILAIVVTVILLPLAILSAIMVAGIIASLFSKGFGKEGKDE